MAGTFNLSDDNSNAGFVLTKALDYADEALEKVLAIADSDRKRHQTEDPMAAEDVVSAER